MPFDSLSFNSQANSGLIYSSSIHWPTALKLVSLRSSCSIVRRLEKDTQINYLFLLFTKNIKISSRVNFLTKTHLILYKTSTYLMYTLNSGERFLSKTFPRHTTNSLNNISSIKIYYFLDPKLSIVVTVI